MEEKMESVALAVPTGSDQMMLTISMAGPSYYKDICAQCSVFGAGLGTLAALLACFETRRCDSSSAADKVDQQHGGLGSWSVARASTRLNDASLPRRETRAGKVNRGESIEHGRTNASYGLIV